MPPPSSCLLEELRAPPSQFCFVWVVTPQFLSTRGAAWLAYHLTRLWTMESMDAGTLESDTSPQGVGRFVTRMGRVSFLCQPMRGCAQLHVSPAADANTDRAY